MLRKVGAILAGLAAFVLAELVAGLLARSTWPAYALAYPTRSYSLDMLIARQAVGMLCSLVAGAAAAWVSRGDTRTVLITGVAMLLVAVVWHIHIWTHYPVWYHLLLFAYLVPLTVLGGRLIARGAAQ